jgi:hypothetical protein
LNLLKCRYCGERKDRSTGIKVFLGFFCSYEHASIHGKEKASIARNKKYQLELKKEANEKKKVRAKNLMTRTEWYKKLQTLVNQYIVHVRDNGKPCFTCGTQKPSIGYHSGHYIHAGSGGGDRRTFIHMNLHKQCVTCNLFKGGMEEAYSQMITSTYGLEKLNWLKADVNHPTLKELFPHWTDIENEINRYRKLLRDNGLKPNA